MIVISRTFGHSSRCLSLIQLYMSFLQLPPQRHRQQQLHQVVTKSLIRLNHFQWNLKFLKNAGYNSESDMMSVDEVILTTLLEVSHFCLKLDFLWQVCYPCVNQFKILMSCKSAKFFLYQHLISTKDAATPKFVEIWRISNFAVFRKTSE